MFSYELLGSKIRKLRVEKGFTQKELAEAVDISLSQLKNIERAKSRSSINIIYDISVALGADFASLVSDTRQSETAAAMKKLDLIREIVNS